MQPQGKAATGSMLRPHLRCVASGPDELADRIWLLTLESLPGVKRFRGHWLRPAASKEEPFNPQLSFFWYDKITHACVEKLPNDSSPALIRS